MKDKETIVFLHLSDIHIGKEKDISDEHIRKIVDSLKSYKSINIKMSLSSFLVILHILATLHSFQMQKNLLEVY